MEFAASSSDCVCKFCKKSGRENLLPVELSDRLNDLNALRSLTCELKNETMNIIESYSVNSRTEKVARKQIKLLQTCRNTRAFEENSAKYIDTCCLQLAEQSVELRKEKELIAQLRLRRKRLQQDLSLKKIIKSSLFQNMTNAPQCIRALRFREASTIFKMMSIVADIPPRTACKSKGDRVESLRGVSTIGGLPLLNSGSYAGIPVEIQSAALSFAAHLVDTVASILNIVLDHPLRPFETFECMASPNFDQSLLLPLTPAVGVNFSTTQHLFGPFASKWRNKLLDAKEPGQTPSAVTSSQRKKEKTNVVENSRKKFHSTEIDMSHDEGDILQGDWVVNPSFSVALSLFRANVITLCLRCGIEGSSLWPHEAVLLNLNLLHMKCIQEAEANDADSEKYKESFLSSGDQQIPTFHSDSVTTDEMQGNEYLAGLIRRYKSQRFMKIPGPQSHM